MYGIMTVFGIDSHARTTTICALVVETGELEARTFRGNPYGEMREWMASLERVRCESCGLEFERTAASLMRGCSCPACRAVGAAA